MTDSVRSLIDIDLDRLKSLAQKNVDNPEGGTRVSKAVTVCESGFNNVTSVRDTAPVRVSEPNALLGDNSAANPSEVALAAMGSCINVGLVANAGYRGVNLTKAEVAMEGDIDISPVWGAGGNLDEDLILGFTAIRCEITIAGDADDETLKKIADQAMRWSPVVNTMQNPVDVTHITKVDA